MSHPPRIQFVVADGQRARWVSRRGDDFATATEQAAEPAAPRHPQGVVFEARSGQRFSVEERNAAVRQRKERFAEDLAARINDAAAREAYERLVLVAPARMLSAIEQRLSPAARSRLVGRLAKDLTKTPDHELKAWLQSLELG